MDVAVIGGGIAGSCASLLLQKLGFQVTLFEKGKSLGGCAGSFIRNGIEFKTAATTIPGLLLPFPISTLFSEINLKQNFKILNPSIIILTPKGVVRRFLSLEQTIDEINRVFPNKRHFYFWKKIYEVTFQFFDKIPIFNLSSPNLVLSTLKYMKWAFLKFGSLYFTPAIRFLKKYYNTIDREYLEFINSQVMITAQTEISNVNALIMLLSLGYPFTGISADTVDFENFKIQMNERRINLMLSTAIESIDRKQNGYVLKSNGTEYKFSKLVLAHPFLENTDMIKDKKIRKYLDSFKPLLNDNGAIVLYGVLRNFKPQGSFYLLTGNKISTFTSRELFISFYSSKDNSSTVFTISTHTKVSDWLRLDKDRYKSTKEVLKSEILQILLQTFNIRSDQIEESFLATPITFKRYLGRFNAGGIPMSMKNHILRIPPNITPFSGLYLCGDMSFGYQGWLGVSVGLVNLINGIKDERFRTKDYAV